MNNKDISEIMKNMNDKTIDRISSTYSAGDDESKERIYREISSRMRNTRNTAASGDEVSGVEIYKRNNITRMISIAATFVLTAGIIGGGAFFFHMHGQENDITPSSEIVTTDEAMQTTTTTSSVLTTTEVLATTETTTTSDIKYYISNFETGVGEEFVFPDAASLSYGEYYGSIGLDLAKHKEEAFLQADRWEISTAQEWYENKENEDAYIWFYTNLEDCHYDYRHTYKNEAGETVYVDNTIYYRRVTDPVLNSTNDLKAILRGVYTNDNLTKQYYEKRFCTLDDNINVGDLINMDELYTFVDYKGKLYCLGPSGGRGYLGKSFYEEVPVIIGDMTETSFTAYVPVSLGWEREESIDDVNEYLRNMDVLYVVFDNEVNEWRISRSETADYGIYEKMKEMIGE